MKDGIGEAALEYANRLASAVSTLFPAVDQGLGWWMPSGLGECDPVEGGVELTVSGAAQSVPGFVRRPHRQGQHPVRTLQYLLRARRRIVVVDGDFGRQTEAAVKALQRHKGLVVDGIVGPITWQALISGMLSF